MHAVILAAGMGTRLGSRQPKPLTEIGPAITGASGKVGGQGRDSAAPLSLIGNQVDILSRLIDPRRIIIVVGYEADRVRAAHTAMRFVENPRHAQTNTARSLELALRTVDDDVLWVNGDLYFEPDAAASMLAGPLSFSRALVDPGAPTGDEPVAYTLHPDGSIAQISKQARPACGESLGMHVLRRSDRQALLDALARVGDQDYFERALETCTLAGTIRLVPIPVGPAFCREVDFPEDLKAVRERVASIRRQPRHPMSRPERVGVFGTGHFGYALLRHLEQKMDSGRPGAPLDLCAYDHEPQVRRSLATQRRHPFDHLGSPLGPRVRIVDSIRELLADLDVLVLAVPSVSTREVANAIAAEPWRRPLILMNTAKALDFQTGRRLGEVVSEIIRTPPQPVTYAVLSGGTIAGEVLRQNPLGITIASGSRVAVRRLKTLFSASNMWVQTTADVVGVELAGAFKNVISICAGMARGLDLSYGAETHLISRMAQEVEDFCVRCEGARRATFDIGSQCWGNDMWMSCTGPTRNRALGELLGQGRTLDEATRHMAEQHKTVEGVATLRALGSLLKAYPSELPLLRVADEIILRGAPPQRLIDALMQEA